MSNGKQTPIPKNPSELNALVASMDTNIKTIKTDILQPLAKDVREARDTAREARQAIDSHIGDKGAHSDDCEARERQDKAIDDHGKAIAGLKPKVSGLQKWRWSLFGITFSTLVLAGGFIVATKVSSAVIEQRVVENEEDIGELEDVTKSLAKAQQADRETYLRTIKTIPREVAMEAVNASKASEPTIDEVEDAVSNLPLRPHEQRQLIDILKRARKRSNGNE
jgi:hypothetical protein